MTIWVDADNCPSLARNVILKAATRYSVSVVFAANHDVPFGEENPLFKMVICPKTSGSADDYIVSNCTPGDLVITRDLPLAQRILTLARETALQTTSLQMAPNEQKKVTAMNDRGLVFDEKNIVRLLKDRDLAIQLSAIGLNSGKKYNNYSQKEAGEFASGLDTVLIQKTKL